MTDIQCRFCDDIKKTLFEKSQEYGDPFDFLEAVSKRWSNIIGKDISKKEVVMLMLELKMERLRNIIKVNGCGQDTLLDIGGYAAILINIL